MNMYPALSIQISGTDQLSNLGASGAMSSSFPVVPPFVDDKYSSYPDSFWVSPERELMKNPISSQASAIAFNSSIDEHLFTSSTGLPSDTHFSSVSHGGHSRISPFISQSSAERESFLPTHSSHLGVQSTALINNNDGSQDISWCTDPFQDFLNFPAYASAENSQVESSTGVVASEYHTRRDDWQWARGWINSELEPDCNELPNVSVVDPKPKQPQIRVQQPAPPVEFQSVDNAMSTAPPTKFRMRWTPERHEAFVEAVNQLGGSDQATPSAIKILMNVEGLTIFQVKSHLQKYRTAKFKPESSGGTSEKIATSIQEVKSLDLKTSMGITEALQIQMELQKRLHEQLENQRQLQLEIEKQGQHLKMMLEKQRKMEDDRIKASTSALDDPSAPLSNIVQPSPVHDNPETSKLDELKSGPGTSRVNATPEDSSWDVSRKQKAHESEDAKDQEPGCTNHTGPLTKRARADQIAAPSTEFWSDENLFP
ncbi:hypothetical protein I3843_07G072100 [Carya illinoinensis]|nr:hypothetical protein I3842_07G075200 [Carya illinoinensis]KAG6703259.1 hypothetical protein I3842_07G075200 [Carya illinoinensis]KAG7970231.1 hypothetical protein I3843_07G072100 [Carya illinoinensis]KAG7970232.1 hypothetical protein I3843_07G072100 [Carya illinoinensis]